MSPVTGYGPYQATFRGGLLDGETREVISLAPGRLVRHGPGGKPGLPVGWDGKRVPFKADVYEIDMASGEGSSVDYVFQRTVGG